MGRPFNTTRPLGRLMAAADLTVADMDDLSGVSYRTISDYLAGRRVIKPEHAAVFARVLEVDVAELTAGDVAAPAQVRAPSLYG